MTPETLKQLISDRDAKRTVIVATGLKSGKQWMIYPGRNSATDTPLYEEAVAAARADKPRTIETEDEDVFLNVFNPPLRMIIVGAVHISQVLAPIAEMAGYDVTIIDPRQAWATPERFPGITISDVWPDEAMATLQPDHRTAIVTLTHDTKLDDPALIATLRSDAFYIGSLGSNRTHGKRLQRLHGAGFSKEETNRIHAPVGLDIGSKSPAEIAISIMAQVTETLRKSA